MENPFVYGEVVPAAAFVDREVELDRLVADLAAGQKVFLISPRRYGKSSLIRHALATLARRGVADASRSRSAATARTSRSSRATRGRSSPLETRWDRARVVAARDQLGRAPRAALEPDAGRRTGGARRGVSRPSARRATSSRLANEVFALPGRLADAAAARGRRRARRVPGRFDGVQRRHASSTRCARPSSSSARSATSSPAPSRA